MKTIRLIRHWGTVHAVQGTREQWRAYDRRRRVSDIGMIVIAASWIVGTLIIKWLA